MHGGVLYFVVTCVSALGSRKSGRHNSAKNVRRVANTNWFKFYCDTKNFRKINDKNDGKKILFGLNLWESIAICFSVIFYSVYLKK